MCWYTSKQEVYLHRYIAGIYKAESKEKHGVWDPIKELTNLILRRLRSRLQHMYHGQPYARVDLNPMPESTVSPQELFFDLRR